MLRIPQQAPIQSSVLGTNSPTVPPVQEVVPDRIIIPAIGIDTAIQQVGLTEDGAMEVPSNNTDVGWFKFGPPPGQIGSAVITGHYDGENGATGIFEKLHTLQKGDKIYIKDTEGQVTNFTVRETRKYNPDADASEVFNQTESSHLNLITCDGSWETAQNSYSKRLVVFTDAIL
ncbi:MAG: class F sortase [bacterium]|nr:class F sortase [bacterium]